MTARFLKRTIIAAMFCLGSHAALAGKSLCLESAEKAAALQYVSERGLSLKFAEESVYSFVESGSLREGDLVYVLTLFEKFQDGFSESGETYEVHLDPNHCKVNSIVKL